MPICHEDSPTTAISRRITTIPKEWEERRETIIRTISKQHTGGVTKTRDHYCPAKFSGSRPNSLKIRPITHGRSRNDLNWKGAGLTSFRRSTG